jgi:hypothetical protein
MIMIIIKVFIGKKRYVDLEDLKEGGGCGKLYVIKLSYTFSQWVFIIQ